MEYPHIVEVDLLGMTGTVVDRLLCKDVLVDPSSGLHGEMPPSPPHDMKVIAVVHQPASGRDPEVPSATRSGVSAVSFPLQRSAGKEGIAGRVSGKQRYLALWNGGSRNGGRPAMVFEADLVRKGATKAADDKFTTSKKYDLHLLLQDSAANSTIPLGRALLTVRPGLSGEHNLVVHPFQDNDADSSRKSVGSKPVYSVDPSARLRVLISVTERYGNSVSRGSFDSRSSIPRVSSKHVNSIEAIRSLNGSVPILVEGGHLLESSVNDHTGTNKWSGRIAFQEEKKEGDEMLQSNAIVDCTELDEAFEVQEEDTIVICGGPIVSKGVATGMGNKSLAAARRPPKPPGAGRSNKNALIPPPPPGTPPPKLRAVKKAPSTSTPTARANDAAPSTPDNSSISSSSATLPRTNTGSLPENLSSHNDADTTEAESKTSTGSKASGSSFSAGLMSLKPQLTSHLHQASQTGSGGRKMDATFQRQRRVSIPENVGAEILVPQETSGNLVTFPANETVVAARSAAETRNIPFEVESKDDRVQEDASTSIWTELWPDDGDETTKCTFDDDSRTFDTRQTATTYDRSQWGSVEKIMAMIPWAKIDSIVDRTKIDTLIDKIPIGTLTSLAAFASPAEFDEETYDNASLLQESAIETDEGSFTTYRGNGSFDDDTFIERHSSLFKAVGCWIPTVPAGLRRPDSLVKRSSRFEPKFDLPDHFSAVAAADEASTIDGASIAAASETECKMDPVKQLTNNNVRSAVMSVSTDFNSLAASSVPTEVVGSMFKRTKAPFTKQVVPLRANGDDSKTPACVTPEKPEQHTMPPVLAPPAENVQPLVVTPQRTLRSEPSSPPNRSKLDDAAVRGTEVSPVAVREFPPVLPESINIASITDLFHRKDKVDDESLIDAPSQPEIYVVVDDGASLGDLTMTTHELLVETAAILRQNEPSHERLGESGERQGNSRAGILSFLTCGSTDGLCSATSVPTTWTRAGYASPSRGQPRGGIPTPLKVMDEEETYNEIRYPASTAVPVEMRAAAEAAWAKRTAEVKRGRPPWRKVEGYEI